MFLKQVPVGTDRLLAFFGQWTLFRRAFSDADYFRFGNGVYECGAGRPVRVENGFKEVFQYGRSQHRPFGNQPFC